MYHAFALVVILVIDRYCPEMSPAFRNKREIQSRKLLKHALRKLPSVTEITEPQDP